MNTPYTVRFSDDARLQVMPDGFCPGERWIDFAISRFTFHSHDELMDMTWSLGFEPDPQESEKQASSFVNNKGERLRFHDRRMIGLVADAYLPELMLTLSKVDVSFNEGRLVQVSRIVEYIDTEEAKKRFKYYANEIRQQIIHECSVDDVYHTPLSGWAIIQLLEHLPGLKWQMTPGIMTVVQQLVADTYQSLSDSGAIVKHFCINAYRTNTVNV